MVTLTLRLTPPLTGVKGDMYFIYAGKYYFMSPLAEPSTNGLIQVTFGALPNYDFVVIFPAQTVEGVTVLETETPKFKLTSNVTVNVTLNTEAPPTPPPPPPIEYMKIPVMAIPPLIAGAILVFVVGR